MAAALRDEARVLGLLLSPLKLLELGLLIAVALGVYALILRGTRTLRRGGYDVERRLVGVPLVASGVLGLWVGAVALRAVLVDPTPLVTARLPLAQGVEALRRAVLPDAVKVLVEA